MRKILAVFMLLSTFVSASNLDDLTPTLTLPGARGVAYTPDGQTLVVGHSDDIYIYETATGKATSRIPTDPHETLRNFSISNDGRSLVFIEGRRYQSSTDADGSHAYVYELPSGTFRFSTAANASSPYYGTAYTATFSPDSRFLVTSSWYTNGDLKTWDITTGKTTSFRYASSTVLALGFTPDGATLLTGARDHQVGWFDTRSGTALNMQYGVPNESVVALAISPDGRRVALAVGEHVVVRDVQSRRVLADLEGHTGRVNDIAWSPNGRVLASAGEDATVRIWDTDARTVLKVLNSRGPARAVAVSRDGAALAVAGDDATLVYTAPDHDAVFAPKATLFVSGLQDSMTLQVAGNSPRPVKSATSTFEVYAENQLAVTVSAPGFQPYSTTVRLAPKETRTVSVPPLQPITGGVSFTSTPNGARVSVDGRTAGVTPLTVHDLTPGHHTYTLSANGYSDATNDISVQGDQVIDAHIELREQPSLIINSNPSGATVLLGDRNAGRTPLTLRDVNSGQLRFTLRLNGYQDFEGVALVPTEGQAGVTERLTPSTPPSAVTPPAAKKAPLAVTDTSARNAVYLLDNAPALQLSALLRITDLERFGDRKTLGLVRAGQQIRLQVGPGRGDARVYSSDVLVPLATLAPLGYLARFVDGYVQITFGNDTLVIAKPQARVFSDAYLSTLQKSWTLAIRNAALVDNVLAVRAVDVPSLSLQWKLVWNADGKALFSNGQAVAVLGQPVKGTSARIAEIQGRTYIPLPVLAVVGVTFSVNHARLTLKVDGATLEMNYSAADLPRISSIVPIPPAQRIPTPAPRPQAAGPQTMSRPVRPEPATQAGVPSTNREFLAFDSSKVTTLCKILIEEKLTYPSTVKYPWFSYPDLMKLPTFQQWVWNVNITAMNAFGARVPMRASCVFREDGFTNATITIR